MPYMTQMISPIARTNSHVSNIRCSIILWNCNVSKIV